MSYETVTPAYYQFRQPETPWHAGSRGWSRAPVPIWGTNPNLQSVPRLATTGLGLTKYQKDLVKLSVLAVGVGALTYFALLRKPKRMAANRRRQRRNRGVGCRGRGAYLLPKERTYPAPTKECLKTALAYAAWPNNLPDAGRVIRAARKHQYGRDPDIQAQMRKLATKYRSETGKKV